MKFILLILITLIFGCKTQETNFEETSNDFTIESTEKLGGKYRLANKIEVQNLIDKIYSRTSTKLKKESIEIAILDLYHNETNYIWYASINEFDEIYRFIADKYIEAISFEKLEKTKIKEELANLKN